MGEVAPLSPFVMLTCSMNKEPQPIRLRPDLVISILVGSPGADVWDTSGCCHRTKESPEEVERLIAEKLGMLGLVPPIVPTQEVPE